MSKEPRGQQSLNLTEGTQKACNSFHTGQIGVRPKTVERPSWSVRISLKAQDDKSCVFSNLMKHFNKEVLHEAFDAINGRKALGVDKVSKSAYEEQLDKNLEDLIKRVHNGSYRPLPKREVLIPKSNGKLRPIAIASFEDKLVDWCVGKILNSLYEPLFIRNSFGFRPNKSAHGAVAATYYSLEKGLRPHVVEIDFSNFFNTIPHKKLMEILSKRIADQRFLGLVRRLLTGDILKASGEILPSTLGTPQGGISSPILANLYLNEVIDQWFLKNYGSYNNIIVRYADDAVFFFKEKGTADTFLTNLRVRVAQYGISLNEEKTHQIVLDKKSRESFDFLGFTFYRGKQQKRIVLKLKTQKEKLIKSTNEFYNWIKQNRNYKKLRVLWSLAKAKIMGHINYFGYGMNNLKINHFYSEAVKALFKWLNRRSQKRSYTIEGFMERIKHFPLKPHYDQIKWKQLGGQFGNK